jgi:hypothetical protein
VIDCGASEPVESLVAFGADGSRKALKPSALHPALGNLLDILACRGLVSTRLDWLAFALEHAGLSQPDQADLLRDVIRGPFAPLFFRSTWRTENGGASQQVARVIYDEESFDQLPILADALLDAGCDCDEVLDHLRGPGPHVRGCWPLDLVLGDPKAGP